MLILLDEVYGNNWAEKAAVFNGYFKNQIVSPLGLSESALRSMHREIKGRLDRPLGDWKGLRASLEDTASNRGITLQVKPPGDLNQNLSTAVGNIPRTPIRGQSYHHNNGLLTPIETPSTRRYSPVRELPRLGFRAFNYTNQGVNSATHFRAGSFVGLQIADPPHPSSLTYRDHAKRQISRIHEGTTPFISLTESIVRALHFAFKKDDSYIAIIDMWKAGHSRESNDENPFLQEVHQLNLFPGDPYQGRGEYLVWGM